MVERGGKAYLISMAFADWRLGQQISEIIEFKVKILFLSILMPSDVRGGESLSGRSTSMINKNTKCEPVKLYFYS